MSASALRDQGLRELLVEARPRLPAERDPALLPEVHRDGRRHLEQIQRLKNVETQQTPGPSLQSQAVFVQRD